MKTKAISTLRELQLKMPAIIKLHGNNTTIARAAIINPILALEEIGYELSASLKNELDYYIRFGPARQKKLIALEKEVYTGVGKKFDLKDEKAVEKYVHPLIAKKGKVEFKPPKTEYSFAIKTSKTKAIFSQKKSDPYEIFKDAHPVMKPLLEFRKIESSVARLGSAEIFKKALKGHVSEKVKISSVRFRMKNKS